MDLMTTGLLILLMVASFYFLIIRPSRKRQAEQAQLAATMQPGVRVMLSSGIYGTVVEVGERQAVIEVAPGMNLKVLKQAVMQIVTPDSQFAEDGMVPVTEVDLSNPDSSRLQDSSAQDLPPYESGAHDTSPQDQFRPETGGSTPRSDRPEGEKG